MQDKLKKLNELVTELKSTNSVNTKKEILSKYPECKRFLFYTYNPLIQFGVTSKNLKKLKDINVKPEEYDDLFELLDDLAEDKLTGHKAVATVNNFINKYSEYESILYGIIDRNLKIRVKTNLINKVFPGLIPEFEISLAREFKDFKHKVDFSKDAWLVSRKLDGVRCIAIKDDDKVDFFSRSGKPFYTLDKIAEDIRKLPIESCVLDGEVCIINENDEEDFKAIVSEIRKKDHIIEYPKFKIFDFLSIEEFTARKSKVILSERIKTINELLEKNNTPTLSVLDQTKVESKDYIENFLEKSVDLGWEGLIIRKDTYYEGKRTNNMLKLKQFFEDDFIVKEVETGLMRHILEDEDGNTYEQEDIMMTRAAIEYKGYKVGVGSGWSINQRINFYKDPSLIIGKTITVQHFGETYNEEGGLSLRFPTIKYVYEEGRDI